MSLFSILPARFTFYEEWAVHIFLLLALIVLGPWIAIFISDLIFYVIRSTFYEVPVIGGRARGKQRPRAPALVDPSALPPSIVPLPAFAPPADDTEASGWTERQPTHSDR